jgi:hypothetical protein
MPAATASSGGLGRSKVRTALFARSMGTKCVVDHDKVSGSPPGPELCSEQPLSAKTGELALKATAPVLDERPRDVVQPHRFDEHGPVEAVVTEDGVREDDLAQVA